MRIQYCLVVVLVGACTNTKSEMASDTTSGSVPKVKSNACNLRVFSKEKVDIPVFSAVDSPEPIAMISWNEPGTIFQVTEQGTERLYFRSAEALGPRKSEPSLQGWIPKNLVSVNINMSEVSPSLQEPHPIFLRVSPEIESTVLQTYLQEEVAIELLGCQSSWVKLKVTMASEQQPQIGWLKQGDHCGNPLTNCP
ncbi:MAG: hypothetical protein JKY56_17775 [Kofleriaceae bacterium]|nr:hypothetical protein [Kofleriaceae bacterium]